MHLARIKFSSYIAGLILPTMNETNLTRAIMLKVGSMLQNVRIFRNNVGTGWTGKVIHQGSRVIIENPRPLHAGLCQGSSDLIGWTTVEVTPEMVGAKVALFTAVEVKTPTGRVSAEQANFIQRVRQAGGIAGEARSEADAIQLLNGGINLSK
jgi:hypothetical protein